MKIKHILLIIGIVYFAFFFILGIKSEFTHDLKEKTYLIFSSFICLIVAFKFLILAKKEKD